MAYGECWELQRSLFDALCRKKLDKSLAADGSCGTILIVEHPAVYTLGKSGNEGNMLCTEERLKALGAEFYHIDRGGDITFHGPGQLVCYPIIDLDAIGFGIRRYIDALEQSVIDLAEEYGIMAHRVDYRGPASDEAMCCGRARLARRHDAWFGDECRHRP